MNDLNFQIKEIKIKKSDILKELQKGFDSQSLNIVGRGDPAKVINFLVEYLRKKGIVVK